MENINQPLNKQKREEIAAQALTAKFIIISNNDKEFKRVKGLAVENWKK